MCPLRRNGESLSRDKELVLPQMRKVAKKGDCDKMSMILRAKQRCVIDNAMTLLEATGQFRSLEVSYNQYGPILMATISLELHNPAEEGE